jgi:hypothetical protein
MNVWNEIILSNVGKKWVPTKGIGGDLTSNRHGGLLALA